MDKKPTVLYIFNVSWFFRSHRLAFAKNLINQQGFKIHVASKFSPEDRLMLKEEFIETHDLDFSRSGFNIFNEVKIFFSIIRLIQRIKPDIIEAATLKPVIFTGLICLISKVKLVIWITGLGYVFINKSKKVRMIRQIILCAYRLIFTKKQLNVIFENHDDQEFFIRSGIIESKKAKLVMGAGVDIKKFSFCLEPKKKPLVVVLPGRMLFDKGISNYVEAAKIIKKKNGNSVRFDLVGAIDYGNPASVPREQIMQWQKEGVVNWLGHSHDMIDVLSNSHIVCLPSHREGCPKALLEAASVGRPIVTFDVPGCREVVKHNFNGFLVPLMDNEALVKALSKLIEDKFLRLEMGKKGRTFIEESFEESLIFKKTLAVYNS
jgi:glycosyltransferase involved in cell wall biosynthesis